MRSVYCWDKCCEAFTCLISEWELKCIDSVRHSSISLYTTDLFSCHWSEVSVTTYLDTHTHTCRRYVMTCLPVLIDPLKWRMIQIMLIFFSEAEPAHYHIIIMVLHCRCNYAVDNSRGECKMSKSWLYVRFMLVRVYILDHCSEYQWPGGLCPFASVTLYSIGRAGGGLITYHPGNQEYAGEARCWPPRVENLSLLLVPLFLFPGLEDNIQRICVSNGSRDAPSSSLLWCPHAKWNKQTDGMPQRGSVDRTAADCQDIVLLPSAPEHTVSAVWTRPNRHRAAHWVLANLKSKPARSNFFPLSLSLHKGLHPLTVLCLNESMKLKKSTGLWTRPSVT